MFGELPKIFGRDFVIGHFLPATVFVGTSLWLVNEFFLLSRFFNLNKIVVLAGTTLVGLITLIIAVALLVTNRDIIQFLEGYGQYNPARLFAWIEKRRYKSLLKAISKLEKAISKLEEQIKTFDKSVGALALFSSADKEVPTKLKLKRSKLEELELKLIEPKLKEAERFPGETWLLPTAFGNTIRAFEFYPYKMYGLDPISGWDRLLAVISKEYSELVNTAKAQTDFWINLWFLSLVFIFEYIIISIYSHKLVLEWLPLVTIGFAYFTSSRARYAAGDWGELMKACFDLFLPDLAKKLGFLLPDDREKERQLWERFSQAITYMHPSSLPDRKSKIQRGV